MIGADIAPKLVNVIAVAHKTERILVIDISCLAE